MEYSILILGSMYSGKSEELKRLIKRNMIAGKKCLTFKPIIDNRYSEDKIFTHENANVLNLLTDTEKDSIGKLLGIDARNVNHSKEILKYVDDTIDVVGIDEVQFFDNDIISVIEELNRKNIRVITSGLDMYSNGDVFEITSKLACKCKYVKKIHAVCIDCGIDACYSYKLHDKNKESTIDIGSEGKYIALCEQCKEKRDTINKTI